MCHPYRVLPHSLIGGIREGRIKMIKKGGRERIEIERKEKVAKGS